MSPFEDSINYCKVLRKVCEAIVIWTIANYRITAKKAPHELRRRAIATTRNASITLPPPHYMHTV